ncbi:MAG: hypothetical protein J6Q05_06250, partial [Elusimicrobiaceae bacterium]|nr:hypothetical protein [Elusimicrobiaceae bacterium]
MKVRFLIIAVCVGMLAGCSALQNPSKRGTPVLTDFSNPNANLAYYEFSSSPLDKPSVLTETEETEEQVTQEPGDDEDFTAENIASAYGTYGDVVVTVASHKFKLGENATRQDMTKFQKALDAGYLAALRQYHPVGFTYAMSSVGSINPLSDIEVTCKLSERSANQVG